MTTIHIGFPDYTLFKECSKFYATYKLINEASKTIFQLSDDEQIRKRCRDREKYYQDLRNYECEIEKIRKSISEKDAAILEKDSLIEKLLAENQGIKKLITTLFF